jgi:hypothetical protein
MNSAYSPFYDGEVYTESATEVVKLDRASNDETFAQPDGCVLTKCDYTFEVI